MGWKDKKAKLKPYVAHIPINLWVQDVLQHWATQINIPRVEYNQIRGEMVDAPGEVIGIHNQKQPQAVPII